MRVNCFKVRCTVIIASSYFVYILFDFFSRKNENVECDTSASLFYVKIGVSKHPFSPSNGGYADSVAMRCRADGGDGVASVKIEIFVVFPVDTFAKSKRSRVAGTR